MVWLDFMAYQPLHDIKCQILFSHTHTHTYIYIYIYIWFVNIKTYLSLHISLKIGGLFWSHKNQTFFKYHSTCQTRFKYSQIKNTKCTFMNLSWYTFSLLLLSWQESMAVLIILSISKSWWRLLKLKHLTLALHENNLI